MRKIKKAILLLLKGEFRVFAKKILIMIYLYNLSRKSILIQNKYNLAALRETEKLVVFLIPGIFGISGGLMSIFQLCKTSRLVKLDSLHLIVTFPGYFTYTKNNMFDHDDEQIFRFDQIISHIKNIKELILHIPENYAENFYSDLSKREKNILRSIIDLRINILNQNVTLMPDHDKLVNLYKLTNSVVQSCGFLSYATQEVCDKFHLPLFFIPSFLDLNKCIKKNFKYKEKLILYSPDFHPMKYKILNTIQNHLVGFKLKEIKNLTYSEFLEAIASAMFCISFGEGFDGFYIQPYYANSIGITVYNDVFFPKQEIRNFHFVYDDYDSLDKNIVNDIDKFYKNKELYEVTSKNVLDFFINNINKREDTINGFKRLYNLGPCFFPFMMPIEQQISGKVGIDAKIQAKNKIEKEPILTTIIFTYNHGGSIQRCIESILTQKTDYLYQIYIWDDCSTDGTTSICKKYAKKYPDKITLIVQKENTFLKSYYKLQSYAAIQKVKSKYFCIIDGDDYWLDENKIQIAIDFLEQNTNYIGFAHDTLIVDKFAHTNLSYIHDCLKWDVTNQVTFSSESPFFLTSSRIFRNSGYAERKILPIDYLLYYYHLSKGPIYYYDKIMAAYVQSQNSSFVSLGGSKIKNLNSMFAYKLSLLFNFKQDQFCTNLQKKYDVANSVGKHRYLMLRFFKSVFGVRWGWNLWFFLTFVPKYGLQCVDIHYVFCHKEVKKHIDSLTLIEDNVK